MKRAAIAGLVGLALCVLAAVLAPAAMAQAWLTIALLALGFPLGALTILMIDNLTGGRWGEGIRPQLLAMSGTLPVALALFLPLFPALPALFPWVGDPTHLSVTAQQKLAYLNVPGLALRFAICAALWLALAVVLGVWNGGRPWRGANALVSGLGLGVHSLVFTVFATDWMEALEPDFYSTIYPMLVASEQVVLALAAIMLIAARAETQPGGAPKATLGEDLARLLVSAVFFWGYLAFMQWIVIWSGDLPDEIGWYLERFNNGWQWALWGVVILGFAVPFAGFVGPRGKRDPKWRTAIVIATLAGQVLEGIWRIVPAFPFSFLTLALLVPSALAIGGLGLAAMAWLADRQRPAQGEEGAHVAR